MWPGWSPRHEDCGTCLQIEVNLARKAGLPLSTLQAVLEERPGDLAPEVADAYGFAEEVVRATGGEAELRRRLLRSYGDEGLLELTLAIAVCRIFPTTKRGLGFAVSCSTVRIESGN